MHNPIQGVVTSEHKHDGGYTGHRGRDIGTRDRDKNGNPVWVYGVGRPVYAAFSGRWQRIVRWAQHKNSYDTWAPLRTGNGGLVSNPDGEAQGYNHVMILPKWKEGGWINKGELIGHLDLSGQMSAPHLHFECWRSWKDPYSDFSPKILFDKYGVDTMADPSTPPIVLHSANKTGTTQQTPEREWSDMATKDEIKAAFREVLAEHKAGIDLTDTTAWRVKDGKQQATTFSRVIQEVHGLGVEAARAAGATEQAIKAILERPRENENIGDK